MLNRWLRKTWSPRDVRFGRQVDRRSFGGGNQLCTMVIAPSLRSISEPVNSGRYSQPPYVAHDLCWCICGVVVAAARVLALVPFVVRPQSCHWLTGVMSGSTWCYTEAELQRLCHNVDSTGYGIVMVSNSSRGVRLQSLVRFALRKVVGTRWPRVTSDIRLNLSCGTNVCGTQTPRLTVWVHW